MMVHLFGILYFRLVKLARLIQNGSVQLVRRLGGYEAAAFALWWLEEGSNSGLHFDQAFAFLFAVSATILIIIF